MMKDKEYIPQDFKNIVNSQLRDISMNREMMNQVKNKCYNKESIGKFYYRRGGYKFIAGVLGAICIFTGTGYAITNVDGFSKFMSSVGLEKVADYIQPINRSALKSNVRLVVEEAITDNYNTLLVFSIINEGDTVWDEHTEVGYWGMSSQEFGHYGPPIVSEDGKKLTYYVESTSFENIYDTNHLSLSVKNINETKEYAKSVDILLEEIVSQKEIKIIDKDYELGASDRRKELKEKLKKAYKANDKFVIDEESNLVFECAEYAPDDITDEEGMVIQGRGLTLYTRNQDKEFFRGKVRETKLGCISELTDIRTGKVYTSTGQEFIDEAVGKGALGISCFPDIKDVSIVPYLKVTKITYDETNILVKDTWKVNFELKQDEDLMKLPVDVTYTENGTTVHISHVTLSKFGLILEGTFEGILIVREQPLASETLKVELEMKDGSRVLLIANRGGIDMGKYIATYATSREETLWNIDRNEVKAIYINEQRTLIDR